MPALPGFAGCWGISIIHCPYCHGYEVRNQATGILGNGDFGYNIAKEINHWTKSLALFTNGKATLTEEQTATLKKHNIAIVEAEIDQFVHRQGQLQYILFQNGSRAEIKALYARPPYEQHCKIPETLGCELTEQGHIKVDMFQKTTVRGIFACGDNSTPLRSVSNAVAMGTTAGAMTNKELIEEEF
jgi:thioredoxin reductase